jgi:hypothetical protein
MKLQNHYKLTHNKWRICGSNLDHNAQPNNFDNFWHLNYDLWTIKDNLNCFANKMLHNSILLTRFLLIGFQTYIQL